MEEKRQETEKERLWRCNKRFDDIMIKRSNGNKMTIDI